MITHDQLRMNVLHKLIDNGWHAVDFDGPATVEWCNRNLGNEYINWEIKSVTRRNARWMTARIRTAPGWQWFCAFKNAEDLMWYRMNFDCTAVDKFTNTM